MDDGHTSSRALLSFICFLTEMKVPVRLSSEPCPRPRKKGRPSYSVAQVIEYPAAIKVETLT